MCMNSSCATINPNFYLRHRTMYRWSVKEDERMFRIQKRLDDFQEDDVSR